MNINFKGVNNSALEDVLAVVKKRGKIGVKIDDQGYAIFTIDAIQQLLNQYSEMQKALKYPETVDKDSRWYLQAQAIQNASDWLGPGVPMISDLERKSILIALRKHEYNLTNVSNELGVSRSTLYRKIKQYGISKEVKEEF